MEGNTMEDRIQQIQILLDDWLTEQKSSLKKDAQAHYDQHLMELQKSLNENDERFRKQHAEEWKKLEDGSIKNPHLIKKQREFLEKEFKSHVELQDSLVKRFIQDCCPQN